MIRSDEAQFNKGYVHFHLIVILNQANLSRRGAYDTTGVKKPGVPPPPKVKRMFQPQFGMWYKY